VAIGCTEMVCSARKKCDDGNEARLSMMWVKGPSYVALQGRSALVGSCRPMDCSFGLCAAISGLSARFGAGASGTDTFVSAGLTLTFPDATRCESMGMQCLVHASRCVRGPPQGVAGVLI
jgi:hypothetical protein